MKYLSNFLSLENYTKKQVITSIVFLSFFNLIYLIKILVLKYHYHYQPNISNIGAIYLIATGIIFLFLLGILIKGKNHREKRIATVFFTVWVLSVIADRLLSMLTRISPMIILLSLHLLGLLLCGYMIYEVEMFYRTTKAKGIASSSKHDIINTILFLLLLV
jgi:hypothetical protein